MQARRLDAQGCADFWRTDGATFPGGRGEGIIAWRLDARDIADFVRAHWTAFPSGRREGVIAWRLDARDITDFLADSSICVIEKRIVKR